MAVIILADVWLSELVRIFDTAKNDFLAFNVYIFDATLEMVLERGYFFAGQQTFGPDSLGII